MICEGRVNVVENGFQAEVHDAWTQPQAQWTESETQDLADIAGAPLFYTEPIQQATDHRVEDDEEEAIQHAMAQMGPEHTVPDDPKKKGESHRGMGFTEKEDKCLCESWLAVSHDCINGVQQKGLVYWRKVVQEYHERKLHEPYSMHSSRTEESLRKRWAYIKQETSKFCSAMGHVVANPVSGIGVLAVVPRALEKFKSVHHKGFYMVHCWDMLKGAMKWRIGYEAFKKAVDNGTTSVMVSGEDDALPPRPRGQKSMKADLAREASAQALSDALAKIMADAQVAHDKRDEKRRRDKVATNAIYHNLTKEVTEVQRADVEAKKADADAKRLDVEVVDAEAKKLEAEARMQKA